jgi:16S rRNA (cytosine1407-C5)-methyltransferase
VRTLWKGKKIGVLAGLQRMLLRHAAMLLAPGGRLLYSTCTTNPAENQDQVNFAREELGLVLEELLPFPGFAFEETGLSGTLLVDGAGSDAQGFFLALLRKPASGGEVAQSMGEPQPGDDGGSGRARTLGRGRGRRDGMGGGVESGEEISPATIAMPGWDGAALPPGRLAVFGDKVRFLHRRTEAMLPGEFVWQGAMVGRLSDGRFRPAPRLRAIMADAPDAPRVVCEDVAEIRSLLAGKDMSVALDGQWAGLWWRDLPLGWVGVKRGRAIAAFA